MYIILIKFNSSLVKNKNNFVLRNKYKLYYSLDYLLNMGHYLDFKLFLKLLNLLIN